MPENNVEAVNYRDLLNKAILQSDIVKIFDYLLTIWVEEGASDIHIEPFENYCRIRIRIDWVLEELVQYPKSFHDSIISKFKIESGQMRPDEKRLPQDARVSATTETNKEIDLRANTLPTVWWEKLVMRIVDKSKEIPPLSSLWLEWSNWRIMAKNLAYPNWIILNTWPTGSWKTTTLYSALSDINKVEVNITTFEDPVENKMLWLNQAQVRSDIGFTFLSWLRSALRQDPDIIMVWEIRDRETLEMAMESSMTWHLVFSTVHTNSAVETITRVAKMGAEPYMIAGTFNLVIAQRLWRKVCTHCWQKLKIKPEDEIKFRNAKNSFRVFDKELLKKELQLRKISQEEWNDFFVNWYVMQWTWKDPQTWEVCPVCKWSGYKWRLWIYEMMDYTDDIKWMLIDWKSAFEVWKYALSRWMIDLERDGIFKAMKGEFDLHEVYRFVKLQDV